VPLVHENEPARMSIWLRWSKPAKPESSKAFSRPHSSERHWKFVGVTAF
jgi:hypothetical protein